MTEKKQTVRTTLKVLSFAENSFLKIHYYVGEPHELKHYVFCVRAQ